MNKKYVEYYSKPEVKAFMVRWMYYREISGLAKESPHFRVNPDKRRRYMRIYEADHFDQNMRRWEFWDNPVNFYSSLASYDYMPRFDFNLEKRKRQIDAWKMNASNHINTYDFALDLDTELHSRGRVIRDMLEISSFLRQEKISHSIRHSGSGKHIVVYGPYVWAGIHFKPEYIRPFMTQFKDRLVEDLDLKTVDHGVYDIGRIWKLPGSIDIKTAQLCIPMTQEEILEHPDRGYPLDQYLSGSLTFDKRLPFTFHYEKRNTFLFKYAYKGTDIRRSQDIGKAQLLVQ